ncbi:MAG: S9 family peptidase, partial [Pedobacter sp.]
TSEPHQLSTDGSSANYYSPYLYWSPDSKKIAAYKVKANKPHILYLIESSPSDQLQPKLHTRNYLKPGDEVQQFKPSLFLIDSMKQIFIDTAGIQNQYDLSEPVWRKDSRSFTFEYNKRGHQNYAVMEVSEAGGIRKLINEESKTFIHYSGKKYRYDLADGKEIIWASERDGWNHLYLFDKNGTLKNQITKGAWVVRRVISVNEADRTLLFEGSGMEEGMDPYFIQYYKINLDGTGLKRLTNEDGNHKAVFNDDYSLFIDSYSRIDEPSVSLLRDGNTGKILMELEKADITPLLSTGWKLPEVFHAKGRDGETDIWGMIIRPSNFDPTKTYPVIEYIYAGPHDSFVPKSFANDSRGSLHELAELGFIVVQCDGMGTSNRSKAFHDVCWQNLKDGGFPDRIAFMKAAAKRYPYMDLSRVGIFGNSAGGQSSLGALLFHPDFYKVAVSSSGCHDNRMDKIWWNEQWMGYPIGPQYAASSNVEHADKLQGKLLLILGELDDNVDPSSTMQVMNKLIKANKDFDFLMVPGMKHSLGGDYGEHKRRDFFVKHLLGINPPDWTWTQNITVPKP